jgi:nucleotide-binding universal stress UspA family protein
MCAEFCPVGKLEKLLLATDGSQYSEGAIDEAINLAKKCTSMLYAVSVLETNPEYETIGAKVFEKEEADLLSHLESIKSKAAKEGLVCETVLHEAIDPAQVIVDEASEKKVDVIVIGRHGHKGLLKLLMGEIAEKVVGHAPCKVLVVPKAAKIGYRTILVATDGSAHSDAAVTEALTIAKYCGSNVIALSVVHDDGEIEEARANVNKVVELGQRESISVEALTPGGRSYDVIVETACGRGVDLIVVGAYGRTGIKRLLMGSTTEKVIGNAGCAVLVAKA